MLNLFIILIIKLEQINFTALKYEQIIDRNLFSEKTDTLTTYYIFSKIGTNPFHYLEICLKLLDKWQPE